MGGEMTAHQALLLEMLKDFDAVCHKHGIRYQLFAGTALGAVRHHGFIPWDDDLDVILMRSEYDRFFAEAAEDFDPEIYYVQQENGAHWPMQFSKLRRNDTACIEKYHPKDPLTHQGVYIDIFPCDNLSDRPLMRKLQFAASKVVIARSLYQRGYVTDSMTKKIVMRLSRIAPIEALHRFAMNREDTGSQMVHSFFGASSRYERSIYRREWLTETVPAPFEDGIFPISAYSDELLTCLYGEWRKIPPQEERACKVHGVIVDLDRPYTDYLEQQQNMEIKAYSRSIR